MCTVKDVRCEIFHGHDFLVTISAERLGVLLTCTCGQTARVFTADSRPELKIDKDHLDLFREAVKHDPRLRELMETAVFPHYEGDFPSSYVEIGF